MHTLLFERPRVCGGQVLYLDYDGVMHHEKVYRHPKHGIRVYAGPQFTLFQHAPLLGELLRPYHEVRIVLSTSWVRALGMRRAASYLPDELRQRVVGATFHSRMLSFEFAHTPRGLQVYEDYLRRSPSAALAIDDTDEGWPAAFREHLVLTDEAHGISHPSVLSELKSKLASHFSTDPRSTP
jgi:hypothetical protein